MINVSDEVKAKYLNSSTKTLTISFPSANITLHNNDIVQEQFSLDESINAEQNLTFTGCISSQIKFKCVTLNQDVRGKYVEVSISADNTTEIPLFKGYVDTQTNLTYDDETTEITAYDVLHQIENRDVYSWYNSLAFPMTLKSFRDSLFAHIGITQSTVTLPNDSLSLSKSIHTNTLNALDVLKWICQANARFGKIGRDGKFQYIELNPVIGGLYPANDLYPSNDLYPAEENANAFLNKKSYKNIEHGAYRVKKITGVKLFDASDVATYYGTSENNVFCVQGNPIAYGLPKSLVAQNIFSEVNSLDYDTTIIDCVGLPYIETGDIVSVNTNRNILRTYVLKRTLTGIHNLLDTYAGEGEENQPQYKATQSTTQLAQERYSREQDVMYLSGVSEELSTNIDTQAGRITAEVTRATTAEGSLSSRIEVLPASISLSASVSGKNATISVSATPEGGGQAVVSSDSIEFNGLVSFNDLSTQGQSTFINGANIITGTVTADRVQVGTNTLLADSSTGTCTIANFTVSENSITSSNFVLNSNASSNTTALSIGSNFTVTGNGNITASYVTLNSGRIGNFSITNGDLYAFDGGKFRGDVVSNDISAYDISVSNNITTPAISVTGPAQITTLIATDLLMPGASWQQLGDLLEQPTALVFTKSS